MPKQIVDDRIVGLMERYDPNSDGYVGFLIAKGVILEPVV